MKGKRDNQRSKVYALGQAQWNGILPEGHELIPLDKCQRLVDLCYYRLKGQEPHKYRGFWGWRHEGPPLVTDGRRRRKACYSPSEHEIKLPRWARHGETVIHEVAHSIVRGRKYAWHGPEFMKVMIHLLSFVYQVPESVLRAKAKEYRIKSRSNFPLNKRRVSKARLNEFRNIKKDNESQSDTDAIWKKHGVVLPVTVENVRKYVFGMNKTKRSK